MGKKSGSKSTKSCHGKFGAPKVRTRGSSGRPPQAGTRTSKGSSTDLAPRLPTPPGNPASPKGDLSRAITDSPGDDLADETGDIGIQSDADDDPTYLEDEEDASESSDPETPSPPPKNKKRRAKVSKKEIAKRGKSGAKPPPLFPARVAQRAPMPTAHSFRGVTPRADGARSSGAPPGGLFRRSSDPGRKILSWPGNLGASPASLFRSPHPKSTKVLSPTGRENLNLSQTPAAAGPARRHGVTPPKGMCPPMLSPDMGGSPEIAAEWAEFLAARKRKADSQSSSVKTSASQEKGERKERGALVMASVLVSDGFVGLEQTATLQNNAFMMTVARASSFVERSTEKDFTVWLRRSMHSARHKVFGAGRRAAAMVIGQLASERGKRGTGPESCTRTWNVLSVDLLSLAEESMIVETFKDILFRPYIHCHEGVSGGQLHLAEIVGGAADIRIDVLESILKPVVLAAIATMRSSSPDSMGFSLERAKSVAESWVTTPNGGHSSNNHFECAYAKTFWRCLYLFATQGERRLGLIPSLSPEKITKTIAFGNLFPYLSGGMGQDGEVEDVDGGEGDHVSVDANIDEDSWAEQTLRGAQRSAKENHHASDEEMDI